MFRLVIISLVSFVVVFGTLGYFKLKNDLVNLKSNQDNLIRDFKNLDKELDLTLAKFNYLEDIREFVKENK